jgi:hypothetical protein
LYCFIYLLRIACFVSLSLDAADFDNLPKLEHRDFEQLAGNLGK